MHIRQIQQCASITKLPQLAAGNIHALEGGRGKPQNNNFYIYNFWLTFHTVVMVANLIPKATLQIITKTIL